MQTISPQIYIYPALPKGIIPIFNSNQYFPKLGNTHIQALGESLFPANSLAEIKDTIQMAMTLENYDADNERDLFKWLSNCWRIIILSRDRGINFPPSIINNRILLPIPVFRWSLGQRLNQTWLDLYTQTLIRLIKSSTQSGGLVICYAENLLKLQTFPITLPQSDVTSFGIWERPERLSQKGVILCQRTAPTHWESYLPSPTVDELRVSGVNHAFLADAGIQIFTPKAVRKILHILKSNPNADFQKHFLVSLGEKNSELSSKIVILKSKIHFLQNGRELIHGISSLMNFELDETKLGIMGAKRHPDQYLQNSRFNYPLRLEENHTLWIESSIIPRSWTLSHEHILTGIPFNEWDLKLEPKVCLDFTPINESEWCIKFFKIDDCLNNGFEKTHWMDKENALHWFQKRNLFPPHIQNSVNFADLKIFPILSFDRISPRFIEWLTQKSPDYSKKFIDLWENTEKFSLNDCIQRANYCRLENQRQQLLNEGMEAMFHNNRWSVFYKTDLESTAMLYSKSNSELPNTQLKIDDGYEPLQIVHDRMFRSAVIKNRNKKGWEQLEEEAFSTLCQMLVNNAQIEKVNPQKSIIEDQVVWGRCPVRLDLAGGWTDTPPYCLERGGRVVNLAVNLNGQSPIQVFTKLRSTPELFIHSIDQGKSQLITTYEELRSYAQPGDNFALSKAALAQAGFLPEFTSIQYSSLREQLEAFGGGLEISLLSAVPKGSGLGTSSILAATILATLGETCGLCWDKNALFTRTLALEQMLTTGGGWQDQAGGIFNGIKMIETTAGLSQTPILRWLPGELFQQDYANKVILLYYTGITRMAKNILHEIVRGIFLNSPRHLGIIEEISENAKIAFNAIQTSNYQMLVSSVRESWRLNQLLDRGTNPPEVKKILDSIEDYLDAAKLLGAGGGGYLIMFAKSTDAALKIQQILKKSPPNKKARFIQFSLSEKGLQLTRS